MAVCRRGSRRLRGIAIHDRMPPRRKRDRSRRGAARPQGLLRSRVVPADRPMDLTARAGLVVVAETLLALGLDEVVGRELRVRRRQRGLGEFDKVQAIVLLLAAGGERVEEVRAPAEYSGREQRLWFKELAVCWCGRLLIPTV